jgi:hypothetical protein
MERQPPLFSRTALMIYLATLAATAVLTAADDSAHESCIAFGTSSAGSTYFHVYTDSTGTTIDRFSKWFGGTDYIDRTAYSQLNMPTGASSGEVDWPEGVKFAEDMRSQRKWVSSEATTSATWEHIARTREDVWRFNSSLFGSARQFVFSSTNCDGWNNCPGRGGTANHCFNRTEECCGYNTISPQCLEKSSGDKCCTWFLGAISCEASEVCCGGLGPGASSSAYCCDAGSTCCHTRSPTTGAGACCPSGTTCCAGVSVAVCCQGGQTCDATSNSCAGPNNAPAPFTTTTTAPIQTMSVPLITRPPSSPSSAAPKAPPTSTLSPSAPTPSDVPTRVPQPGETSSSAPASTDANEQPQPPPGPNTSAPPLAAAIRQLLVQASVTIIGTDFGVIILDPAARDLLRAALVRDLAAALQVSTFDMEVSNFNDSGRSVAVSFSVNHTTADAAVLTLARVLALPVSNVTLSDATVEYRKVAPSVDRLSVANATATFNIDNRANADSTAGSLAIAAVTLATVLVAVLSL